MCDPKFEVLVPCCFEYAFCGQILVGLMHLHGEGKGKAMELSASFADDHNGLSTSLEIGKHHKGF